MNIIKKKKKKKKQNNGRLLKKHLKDISEEIFQNVSEEENHKWRKKTHERYQIFSTEEKEKKHQYFL